MKKKNIAEVRLFVSIPAQLKSKIITAAKKRKISMAEEVRARLEVDTKKHEDPYGGLCATNFP
jgi:hypothetical protein